MVRDNSQFYGDKDYGKKKKKHIVRGWYFPPEVIELFHRKLINPRGLVVLGVIDSWTKTYDNGLTIGCFASNKTIGEQAGVSALQVSTIVSKLEKVGVLRRYTKVSRKNTNVEQRYLVPCWRKEGKIRARVDRS